MTWTDRPPDLDFPGRTVRSEELEKLLDLLEAMTNEDASYSTAGALTVGSTGAEVAMASWAGADKAWTFKTGSIYALECQCGVHNSGAGTVERAQIRLRKALNSTSAQVLGNCIALTLGNGTVTSAHWTSYIANNTGVDLTGVHIGLTVQRVTGANTNHIFGDATVPAIVTPRWRGLIVDNPNLAAIAVSIT